MAGETSARLREESDRRQAHAVAWRGLCNLLASARFSTREEHLRLAVIAQVAALAVGSLTSMSILPLLLISAGLVVTMLVLMPVSPAAAAPREVSAVAPPEGASAMEARSATREGAPRPPPPLPFVGDRISFEPQHSGCDRFADAVSRASRMTMIRRRGWAELMSRVSHELRTPLNAVIGFSDVMNAELLGPVGHPRYREYARHIGDCGRELLKSAEDTLAITSLLDREEHEVSQAPLDLSSVAKDAWAFFAEDSAQRSIHLELIGLEGLQLVSDRRTLRQVLINLFSEAIDRCGHDGRVTVTASAGGDLVQLEVLVRGFRFKNDDTASLAVCLARALLELQGATLIEIHDPSCLWRAVTVLDRNAQRDFFEVKTDQEAPALIPAS